MGKNDDVLSQNLQSNGDWEYSGEERRSFYPPTRKKPETVKFTI